MDAVRSEMVLSWLQKGKLAIVVLIKGFQLGK